MENSKISSKASRAALFLSVIGFSVFFIMLISEIYFSRKAPEKEVIYIWMTLNVFNSILGIISIITGLMAIFAVKTDRKEKDKPFFYAITSIILGSLTFMLEGIIIIIALFIFIS
ncbi:MAG: hypothetical protein PHV06_10130 [bacterium]|nr:hypothetical protein [bacterium]